jgi:hypothetical protein
MKNNHLTSKFRPIIGKSWEIRNKILDKTRKQESKGKIVMVEKYVV